MGSTISKEKYTTPQTVTVQEPNVNVTQQPESNEERVEQVDTTTTENKPSFLYNLKNIFTGKNNNNQPVSTGGKKKTLRKKLKSKKNKKNGKTEKRKNVKM